jgi:formylglycine-generating enzyme required for sulfatase activity
VAARGLTTPITVGPQFATSTRPFFAAATSAFVSLYPKRKKKMKDKHESPYRVRGGSWFRDARGCRSAIRSFWPPGYRYGGLGFRIVFKRGERK